MLVLILVGVWWSDAEGRRTDGHREDINAETDTQTKRCRPPHECWRERGAAHETRHIQSKNNMQSRQRCGERSEIVLCISLGWGAKGCRAQKVKSRRRGEGE